MGYRYMTLADPDAQGHVGGTCVPVSIVNLIRYYRTDTARPPREPRFKVLLRRLGYPATESGGVYCEYIEKELNREAVLDKKKAMKYIANGPCLVSVFFRDDEEAHMFLTYPVADNNVIVINGLFGQAYDCLEFDSLYKRCGLRAADPCGTEFLYCIPFSLDRFEPSYKFE